jgi:hypothetical protein
MQSLRLFVASVVAVGLLGGVTGAPAAIHSHASLPVPSCPAAVGDHTLGGPTNIGIPGSWLQGDGKTSFDLGCTYQPTGGVGGVEWHAYVAWITKANPGHEFRGCGGQPVDPSTTFVSAHYEAFAGVNWSDVPELVGLAKKLLAQVERTWAKPCATQQPKASPNYKVSAYVNAHGRPAPSLTYLRTVGHVHAVFLGTQPDGGGWVKPRKPSGSAVFLHRYAGGKNRSIAVRLVGIASSVVDQTVHDSPDAFIDVGFKVVVTHSSVPGCRAGARGVLGVADRDGDEVVDLDVCGSNIGFVAGRRDTVRVSIRRG